MQPKALTFDFGQTLTELDCELLQQRLAEKSIHVAVSSLRRSVPAGWKRYDEELADGRAGHPWEHLMRALLEAAGVSASDASEVVPWLFSEQPKRNLWRAPIPGMIELVRRVRRSVPVGVISNSEGRLAELARELGWQDDFDAIADSGVLGMQKPGAAIFEWMAERLGVDLSETVHVGDSWSADIVGATAAGARAIWFGGASSAPAQPALAYDPARVRLVRSPEELAGVLREWGLPV